MTQELLHDAKQAPWVSAGTAAEILNVDRSTITRLMQSGKLLPSTHIDHGKHRVPLFDRHAVERLRAIRSGESGDVLDRVDLDAAGNDAAEVRSAYIREEWLKAIETVAARTGGTFHSTQLREIVPSDARGPQSGALITGLVRSRRIEHTGGYEPSNDHRNRHGAKLEKVYRVIAPLEGEHA